MAHPRTLRPGELTAAALDREETSRSGVDPVMMPPLDPAAARWLAVAEHVAVRFPGVANRIVSGPGGRWVLVVLVAIGGGLLGGIGVTAWHASTDSQELLTRIERLERAMASADEHNAWVQDALVALSEGKPLPRPSYRRMAPP